MSLQPSKEVDCKQAELVLKTWLKVRGMGIERCREWNRWYYSNRPFWSVWGLVYGGEEIVLFDLWGIHVYDDGEVVVVTKITKGS